MKLQNIRSKNSKVHHFYSNCTSTMPIIHNKYYTTIKSALLSFHWILVLLVKVMCMSALSGSGNLCIPQSAKRTWSWSSNGLRSPSFMALSGHRAWLEALRTAVAINSALVRGDNTGCHCAD